VATESVTEPTHGDTAEMIASRADRGWDLYLAKRQLITQTSEDTYLVPASGDGTYTVRYGGSRESCECTDFGVHNGARSPGLACKHLVSVALIYARRRRVRSRCEVCGVSSHEKTLVGLRNDRRRGGPKYCLPHHPDSLGGEIDRIAQSIEREAQIQGDG
jgi:hypothetical protein